MEKLHTISVKLFNDLCADNAQIILQYPDKYPFNNGFVTFRTTDTGGIKRAMWGSTRKSSYGKFISMEVEKELA